MSQMTQSEGLQPNRINSVARKFTRTNANENPLGNEATSGHRSATFTDDADLADADRAVVGSGSLRDDPPLHRWDF